MMSSLASDYALRLYCKGLFFFWEIVNPACCQVRVFFNKKKVSHRLLGIVGYFPWDCRIFFWMRFADQTKRNLTQNFGEVQQCGPFNNKYPSHFFFLGGGGRFCCLGNSTKTFFSWGGPRFSNPQYPTPPPPPKKNNVSPEKGL